MARPSLSNKTIKEISTLRASPPPLWLPVGPFLAAYALVAWYFFIPIEDLQQLLATVGSVHPVLNLVASLPRARHEYAWIVGICCAPIAALNVACVLSALWSPSFRARALYSKVSSPLAATHVFVRVKPHKGEDAIVQMKRGEDGSTYFEFHSRKYRWVADGGADGKGSFTKPPIPTKLSMAEYKSLGGTKLTPADLAMYGKNEITIPIPEFKDLMLEHALAPFFLFQMFCVLLWLLDEYWYYAVFTGVMLAMFESTVVNQRLANMRQLRSMEKPPVEVTVLREGKWVSTLSTEIYPYDIIWLQRTGNGSVPCDILLLEGSAVVNESMLTGETTPQIKESVATRDDTDVLNMKTDKAHIVFGGTTLLTCMKDASLSSSHFPPRPGAGAVGVVLRTGFETSQGKLTRTILYSSTRKSVNSREAIAFIACLLVFAIAASAYVLYHGLQDKNRSRWKLLLSCIIIITSVVPPELPMELALAVNTSLMMLHRLQIFCTEPFRIPFAGALDTCCFDKTGTLTADVMILDGVAASTPNDKEDIMKLAPADQEAQLVLAGCNSLVFMDGDTIGDSMEQAALEAIGWNCKGSNTIVHNKGKKRVEILVRHPFLSSLQRMSCIIGACVDGSDKPKPYAVCKGSAEALRDMFEAIPPHYDETFKAFSRNGSRVIALGYKKLSPYLTPTQLKAVKRSEVEKDLTFAGFAVFSCPIRVDAKPTVSKLQCASQRVIMITGDNELTAAWVARELNIIYKPSTVFLRVGDDGRTRWEDAYGKEVSGITASPPPTQHALVVGGSHLRAALAADKKWLLKWVDHIDVFARCAPAQKEDIIVALSRRGHVTLMCGDGTNDVGALKQAHVGVGLLAGCRSAEPEPAPQPREPLHPLAVPEPMPEDVDIVSILRWRWREKQRVAAYHEFHRGEMRDRPPIKGGRRNVKYQPPPPPPRPVAPAPPPQQEGRFAPVVEMGDASMASPFTAKNSSTASTCHLLRLGRCTLVTTLQMYKILALNCLNSAYAMSVLACDGVKLGDQQMTITSLVAAVCLLFLSHSKPLPDLSPEMPHTKVFCPYIILSILQQFASNLYHLISVVGVVHSIHPPMPIKNFDDHVFEPSPVNTAVFLTITWQGVLIFVVNYQGHPFLMSLRDNKPMFYSLIFLACIVLLCISGLPLGPLNSVLEVVPLEEPILRSLQQMVVTNTASVVVVDMLLKALFRRRGRPPPTPSG